MLRVKDICKEKGITLADLAKKMGLSPAGLSMALNRNMTLEVLKKIADALGVEVWELFTASASKEELTALIAHKGEFYKANTVEELEKIVEKIKQNI